MADGLKPVSWIGMSRKDLSGFPTEVQKAVGFALYQAQRGSKHVDAKPLKGFGGAGVVEMVENYDGNTYRAVYTVKFAEAVYVLHCFQKKSTSGISTPQQEINMVRSRLRIAEERHLEWTKNHS